MHLGSQSTSPSGHSPHTVSNTASNTAANILGSAIALLTLVLPIWVIARYTSSNAPKPAEAMPGMVAPASPDRPVGKGSSVSSTHAA